MKVHFKRMAAALLAVVMSMCLAVTAFAQKGDVVPTGTLTVTGDQLIGKDVTAIRMFTARATQGSDNNNESYVFDSYELENVWLDFFKDGIGKDDLTTVGGFVFSESPTDEEYKNAAIKYVATLDNDDENKGTLADFAEKAQDWARSQSTPDSYFEGMIATQKATAASENAGETKGTTTFNNLTPGYYLVFPEGGGTGNSNRATDAMLINIPTKHDGGTTWNIKSTYPTVDKKVDTDNEEAGEAADNGSAQVGDTVTFTLTSKVPDMSDYTEFYFAFHDTLTKGLELVMRSEAFANTDVNVYIYNEEDDEEADANHKVDINDFRASFDEGQKKLDVVFENLKNVKVGSEPATDIEPGDTIVVTYKAMITKDATSTGPATNTVKVEYSNNPSETTHGTSTPDESKVYTYQIGIHKYAGEWNNGSAAYLPGAKFVLSKNETLTGTSPNYSGDEGVIKLAGSGNEYCVATADDDKTTYEFTTNASNEIVIKGLKAGTYYLHEVEAPAGYNKLKEPIKITISVSGEGVSLDAPVYTIGSTSNAASDDTVGIQNKKGIELPETGGIGTTIFYVMGSALALGALVLLVAKKRMNKN